MIVIEWLCNLSIEYKLMIACFIGIIVGFVLGFLSGRMG